MHTMFGEQLAAPTTDLSTQTLACRRPGWSAVLQAHWCAACLTQSGCPAAQNHHTLLYHCRWHKHAVQVQGARAAVQPARLQQPPAPRARASRRHPARRPGADDLRGACVQGAGLALQSSELQTTIDYSSCTIKNTQLSCTYDIVRAVIQRKSKGLIAVPAVRARRRSAVKPEATLSFCTPLQELSQWRQQRAEEALKASVLDEEAAAQFSTAAALAQKEKEKQAGKRSNQAAMAGAEPHPVGSIDSEACCACFAMLPATAALWLT